MTAVYGSIKRGEKDERIALEVDGNLKPDQWERFKAEIQQVLTKYGIGFGDLQIKKTNIKKKKKKKPR